MGLLDYFKRADEVEPNELRRLLAERHPAEIQLIDVRLPREFEAGHLPGAHLIPLDELEDAVGRLDPRRKTIVYCTAGIRSRAGASVLRRHGFVSVAHLTGGLRGWNGWESRGGPEAGSFVFEGASGPDELAAVAWALEEGTRRFYGRMAEQVDDAAVASAFGRLGDAERRHQEALAQFFEPIDERGTPPPRLLETAPDETMEGGIPVARALEWAAERTPHEILELAMALELDAFDRYVRMMERLEEPAERAVFHRLADEERRHLNQLTGLLAELAAE